MKEIEKYEELIEYLILNHPKVFAAWVTKRRRSISITKHNLTGYELPKKYTRENKNE